MQTSDWRLWALGSAVFAALTAILAKVGGAGVNSNLATAIRTSVILLFSWPLVWTTGKARGVSALAPRTWTFLVQSTL